MITYKNIIFTLIDGKVIIMSILRQIRDQLFTLYKCWKDNHLSLFLNKKSFEGKSGIFQCFTK